MIYLDKTLEPDNMVAVVRFVFQVDNKYNPFFQVFLDEFLYKL